MCFRSVKDICAATGIASPTTVKNAIKAMIEAGVLRRATDDEEAAFNARHRGEGRGKGRMSNVYVGVHHG
ncbi:helix-turn-helix domain-containing protein [Defluviimonas sp. WL0050]|uniref:Helix-turn-helix domain-containing protein n=1 Tax=Albidovulum litorale TaxID=2984134 RepID=A0ABT2ZQ80_9RHOB|nr:helix-turn-helix domain-containing protein [Defluviimonas sp. WL0050]MCV2873304.1 helix-turn-helix domain-containing protein [Defluviimonas sp. WL0050]